MPLAPPFVSTDCVIDGSVVHVSATACRPLTRSAHLQAAALYTQAGDYQKTARFYYKKAEDTYYQANNWAAYDDWRRARDQWDYFYSRALPAPLPAVNATV